MPPSECALLPGPSAVMWWGSTRRRSKCAIEWSLQSSRSRLRYCATFASLPAIGRQGISRRVCCDVNRSPHKPCSAAAKKMPSRETLEPFIARVEQNAHAEALQEFYTDKASMRENQ